MSAVELQALKEAAADVVIAGGALDEVRGHFARLRLGPDAKPATEALVGLAFLAHQRGKDEVASALLEIAHGAVATLNRERVAVESGLPSAGPPVSGDVNAPGSLWVLRTKR
jgi:hypothetical protein